MNLSQPGTRRQSKSMGVSFVGVRSILRPTGKVSKPPSEVSRKYLDIRRLAARFLCVLSRQSRAPLVTDGRLAACSFPESKSDAFPFQVVIKL